ncbi:MAG TPA: universal stress protein [Blastocatellia bacterium]|nr:universal stress protein [Blastocatellia bacterium]
MKLLLATDGSKYSDLAAQRIAARQWPDHTELRIITVVEMMPQSLSRLSTPKSDLQIQLKADSVNLAKIAIDQAISIINSQNHHSLEISTAIIEGTPEEAILTESERWGANLIILGAKGHSDSKITQLGSVTRFLKRYAGRPVLVAQDGQ